MFILDIKPEDGILEWLNIRAEGTAPAAVQINGKNSEFVIENIAGSKYAVVNLPEKASVCVLFR